LPVGHEAPSVNRGASARADAVHISIDAAGLTWLDVISASGSLDRIDGRPAQICPPQRQPRHGAIVS